MKQTWHIGKKKHASIVVGVATGRIPVRGRGADFAALMGFIKTAFLAKLLVAL